ncbi:DNA-dependent protein kinase catalytic subunit-like [Diadema setosum]|uniref:DNA-dependent protein kinase catalytic subunit-like n=1 Tax=Diadema setosum TaxID=31175 RepID=UPI003B3B845D
MAAAELQKLLVELHDILTSTSSHAPETAQDLVVDIAQLCLKRVNDNELAFCCSELFKQEYGLIRYLQKAVGKEEFKGSKEQALDFLLAFVKKAKELVQSHAKSIKDVCMSLYTRDKAAKVKAKTFPLLIELVGVASQKASADELGVVALLNKFFEELASPSKLSQTVKHGIYQLLGVLAEFYPEYIAKYSDRILNVLISMLKQQMTSKTKKPEMMVVAGGLLGLSHFLVNFTQSVEENAKHSREIYQYTSMAIDPSADTTRYDVPRAGVQLLARHAAQFNLYLYKDYEVINDRLSFWSQHHNPEMKWAGVSALQSFLRTVADMLVERAETKSQGDISVLKYFIRHFRDIIREPNSSSKALFTAIRGYGIFAAPCKAFMSQDDIRFMFNEIVQQSDQQFLVQGAEERVSQLPTYLQALASIVGQLDEVTDTFLASLEKLIVVVFGSYPHQSRSSQWTSHSALLQTLIALSTKGTILHIFLSRVVYQWILRTCSFPVLIDGSPSADGVRDTELEDELEIQQDARRVSYKSFLELWISLLDSKYLKESEAHGSTYSERKVIHTMLYNELIGGILKVLTKLDLTSNKQSSSTEESQMSTSVDETSDHEGSVSSDPLAGLQPSTPKDFQVFINLVDFTRDLLPTRQVYLFDHWIYRFGHELIQLSSQLPLVSGFYKLLTVCMNMACKTMFFKELNLSLVTDPKPNEEEDETAMDVDGDNSQDVTMKTSGDVLLAEREACFVLFSKFSKEVLVRLKQYKDDLLASCLFLILSLPHQVVRSQLQDVVPAVKMCFKLGLSYHPLAEAGLSAIQTWMQFIPADVLSSHYPAILPLLDGYLRAGNGSGEGVGETLVVQTASKRVGRRRIPVKLLKTASNRDQSEDSPLRKVQLQILSLLGSLGGRVNGGLLETSSQELAQVAVAWDTEPRLSFAVPFMDMKPDIQLDPFLPRIVELALTGSERQTKVAACEALHTLVLFMLGRGSQQPDQRESKSPMDRLYKRVFPALLQLACDVEQVAKQLFESLVMQLIHWFSGNKKYESEETASLLNAILEGIIHPTDTALRDFCARCVKEFLKWSIKQTSKKQQEKSPINTKSLLKRLYSMASHPSAFKRLGAALAFNNIYTIFREEDALIDQFTFEILVVFVESLALAHHDDQSLGTQEQGSEVMKHLERIMRVKAGMLNKETKNRRIPRGMPSESCPTLSHMVIWLLKQCGRPQTECRHQCMLLVYQLTSLLPGRNSPVTWMQNTAKEKGVEYFISRFEGGGHRSGIQKYPTLDSMGQQFSVKTTILWLEFLLAALDCYVWVLGESLLTPAAIFRTAKKGKDSVLFTSIGYFLDKLATTSLASLAKEDQVTMTTFTPREGEDFNRIKCTVLIRLLDFLSVLLGVHTKEALDVVPRDMWSGKFADVLCACVFNPSSLGFNMADTVIMNNLPKTTDQILSLLYSKLPPQTLKDVQTVIYTRITRNKKEDLFSMLPSLFNTQGSSTLDHVELQQLVTGYGQMQKAKLLPRQITDKGPELLDCVMSGVVKKDSGSRGQEARTLTPTETAVGQRLLELALQLGVKTSSLIDCLMDNTPVSSTVRPVTSKLASLLTQATHGALFYTVYRTAIVEQLVKHGQEAVYQLSEHVRDGGWVASIVYSMLEHTLSNKELRKRYGMAIHSAVLTQWDVLTNLGGDDKDNFILSLNRKVLQIDCKHVQDPTHPAFSTVFEGYLGLLKDPKKSLAWKTKALDILYFFVTVPEREEKRLKEALDTLAATHFPLHSSEFSPGSPKYNDYIMALNKILTSLVLTGSLMLLELVISILCRDERHVYEDKIQDALASFSKRLNPEKQAAAANVPFQIFREEKRYPKEVRLAAIQRVCVPLLRQASQQAMITFYKSHIHEILSVLEAKVVKNPVQAFENQLVCKICYFELVELLYSKLSREDLYTEQSVINREYCHGKVGKGNEMTAALNKAAHSSRSEDCRGETVAVELRRQFHCAAYNAIIAIISCVQSDLKFYNGLLFSDNIAKGQFLLDNLLDVHKQYTFDLELDSPFERKKRFVAIRSQARETVGVEDSGFVSGPAHYLSSQYLSDSSLSEDIQQFDFSSGVHHFSSSMESQREAAGSSQGSQGALSVVRTMDSHQVSTPGGDYLEMEQDELNKHECMATMTAVIKHMVANKITPEVNKEVRAPEMPTWMSNLQKKLSAAATNVNIKLFIARLVINCQEVFMPYAKFWLAPLMQLVVSGQTGSAGINYMVLDIMVVLLDWSSVAIPQDQRLASRVLEFLMLHCHHESRAIMKNNLEVIKTLVECWRTVIQVPTRVIYDSLQDQTQDRKNSAIGIQLLGVILANKLHPLSQSCDVDEDRFYSVLASNLGNKYKAVHAAAAEVIGMAMKQMAENDQINDGHLHEVTQRELNQLSAGKEVIYITCIHKIHLHHPAFADRLLNKLLFMLPSIHGQPKTECLEIITARIEKINNVFIEMKNKKILSLLTHKDEADQLTSLKLVNGMLPKLKPAEILYLLPAVRDFVSHPSSACRDVMYSVLMWIYDNFKEEASRQEEGSNEILEIAKETLLKGLSDQEDYLRLRVSNFWSHESRLPTATLDRLVSILGCMYTPSTENRFLGYATNLMLEMTSRSPDFKREVFEHPLSACKFETVQIDHSWRQRHVAISTPLFVETQGQSQGGRGSPSSQSMMSSGESLAGQVRATQDAQQFTATQDLDVVSSRKNAYNWLTGTQDTFADHSSSLSTESSSLLFTMATTPRKYSSVSRRGMNQDGGPSGSREETRKAPTAEEREVVRLKRRFLKDHSSTRAFFAKQASRQKHMREEMLRQQRERRFSQVTMYRQYRAGDLPDIQIKHSDIIAPLQALAQRDSTLARLLFAALFRGIFARMPESCTERECEQCVVDIQTNLNHILTESNQFDAPFISCIQEIAFYHSTELTLDPSAVSTACLTSQQLHIGICLLEKMLIERNWKDERSSKRARTSRPEQSKDVGIWIEVARLYKAMGEFDIVRGIFGALIESQEITQQAVQAEGRGDYGAALKFYSEAMSHDWEGNVPQQEEDFWDEARLHCCNQLTKWSEMESFSTSVGDSNHSPDLSLMWKDDYYQEIYLPYMLQSKLKLLMEGGEDDSLLRFVDSSMKNQEHRSILESKYCEELAALAVLQEDYNRAKYYTSSSIQSFLQEWSSLGPLMASSRLAKLQNIQKLTEVNQFLQLISKPDEEHLESAAIRLVHSWSRNLPDPKRDPISVWDDVALYRCLYMEKIASRLDKTGGVSMETDESKFESIMRSERVLMSLKMADSACQQANFPVAEKHLKSTQGYLSEFKELKPRWTHSYATMCQEKAAVLGPYKKMTTLLTASDQLNKLLASCDLRSDILLLRQHHILCSKSLDMMAKVMLGDGDVYGRIEAERKLGKLLEVAGCSHGAQSEEVCQSLFEKALDHLDHAVQSCDIKLAASSSSSSSSSSLLSKDEEESVASVYMAMASFCDQLLRRESEDEMSSASLPSLDDYATRVVQCTLQAMKHNSAEARQRFPRLLELAQTHPDTMTTLQKEAAVIPSWMFIGWISQMLALLDKSESPAVKDILKAIAKDYPQALVYPFKISSEDFKLDETTPKGRESKKAVEELTAILSSLPLVDDFVQALQKLTHPGFIFKDWTENIKPLMDGKKPDVSIIKGKYNELYQELFGGLEVERSSSGPSGDVSRSSPSIQSGTFWKKFAREWQKKFDTEFGHDGSKLSGMSFKALQTIFKKLYDKMNPGGPNSNPGNLMEYSSWFSSFHSMQGDELEIPGQYSGIKKPMPEYHVKIAGFEEQVRTLTSLRKPKCITIRGNDECEYLFLVKVGEDLRMDQRIEQLFGIMNGILGQDAACGQRGLSLITYQVIPMTPRLGIIEWVKKTTTLKDFINGALTERESKLVKSKTNGPGALLQAWMSKFSKFDGVWGHFYAAMFMKADAKHTIEEFRKRERTIPWDLFRRAFMQLSSSPEAFLTLRAEFAHSYAVLCICQYILGIGDRHLSNFLVSLETGRIVGIDFGHSFGSATQFLPIPELIPFRLTNQIVNVMQPMKIEGILQSSMVYVLRALRQNHELLLNTMDVFIKEPSVDWKSFARKQAATLRLSVKDQEDSAWYPKQKISYARLKLEGANPTYITRKELDLGHSKNQGPCKAFKSACRGDGGSKRAQCPERGLSVEDQVACLIDQATDPNILGRTWQGWEPWI